MVVLRFIASSLGQVQVSKSQLQVRPNAQIPKLRSPRSFLSQLEVLLDLLWDSEALRGPQSFLWALAAAGVSEAEACCRVPFSCASLDILVL